MTSSGRRSRRKGKATRTSERKNIPKSVRIAVLTEAGYRCGVPTCRQILAIDLHHMAQVSEGGGNVASNLLALCPTCHALHHRGEISRESIYAWKAMLVSLSNAFDVVAVDNLLFLHKPEAKELRVSGDGILGFSRLIAANLVSFNLELQNGPLMLYSMTLTQRGEQLISAWISGDRASLESTLRGSSAT